jgi:RHS repeat-associated protein
VLADLTDLADLAALGYRHQADAVLADAFCADTFTQTLDGQGNLVGRRDALGSLTRFTYDQAGIYPVRVDFANGLHVEVEYDYRYGMITRYVEVNGVAQEFSYDAAGRLTAVLRFDDPPGQPYLEYRYDDAAPVASQTTLTRSVAGGSQQRRVEYLDGLAQVLQVRAEAEDGRVTVTGRKDFNARGLLGREYQAYFSAGLDFSLADQAPPVHTSYAYDARGRSVRRAGWQGEVYASSYGRGHVVHRDPLDTPGDPAADTPRTDWHDARGRTVAIAEAREQGGSYLTEYGFDAVGNRVRVQVNGSLFAANTFDGLGRRIRSDYRDAGTWRFLFDAAGRLVSSQDGKGDIVHYRYDAVGRPVELRYGGPAGPVQEEYEYDAGAFAAGSLTRVSGPFGEVRYEYGACRCVMAKTRRYPGLPGPLTVSYSRDSLQRITKVGYPDGHEQVIGYGAGGLIQSLPGVIDSISYGPTGRRTRVAYSSGVVTDYDYDPASLRLIRLRTTGPDGVTTYQDASYDYDPLGAVRGIADAASVPGHLANDRSYGYDALQQLVTSAGTGAGGPYSHAYEYDEWCNPEHFPEGPGAGSLQHQDADHPLRITGVAGQPGAVYQYDESGNLTRSLHHSYEYDARNRLTRVISDSGTVTTHLYDHVGNRVASSTTTAAGGTHQRFDFDGLYLVTNGDAVKIVFDESGQVAMIRSDGSGVVFHQDHLGSHTDETDLASGLLLSHVDYLPFGTPSAGQALAGPFGFGGKLTDADDGLVYFGGRYYLPEIGRFLTPDPSFLLQQPDRFFRAPRSLHLYVYVLNDPLNMIDPYGLFFGIDDLIVAAVGFVVGVAAYAINTAISGGSFSWQEALFSGLMGAASIWLTYSTFGAGVAIIAGAAMLAKPAICGALDKAAMGDGFGSRLLGFFSFAIKFASAPYTSSAGLLIGAFGTGFGLWGKVDWFKGGVLAFEYSPGSSTFSALTTGATVNIWQGNSTAPSFLHELYHSRQYTYFGDAFIPAWILGGVWGLVTSAIAGKPQWGCFPAANPSGTYGNPLESTAETISAGSLCT